jgi:hypothetical protein
MAKKKRPPYTSAGDIEAFFERIRTMQAPSKIDTAWVTTYKLAPKQPSGMPTLLRWLGIIDEAGGADQALWDGLRVPQTRAETLRPLVEAAYAEVFDRLSVEEASLDDLESTFVLAYGMGDPDKQLRCFLTLCEIAGMSLTAAAPRGAEVNGAATQRTKSAAKAKPRAVDGSMTRTAGSARTSPSATGVLVSFAIEIPAEWDEDRIRERVTTITKVLGEAGLVVA